MDAEPSPPWTGIARTVLLAVGVVAILTIGSLLALRAVIDGEWVRARVRGRLGPSYAVDLDAAQPGGWAQSLRLDRLRIHRTGTSEGAALRSPALGDRTLRDLTIDTTVLHDLHLWRFLTTGEVRFETIVLESPVLTLESAPEGAPGSPSSTERPSRPRRATTPNRLPRYPALPPGLRSLGADTVRIRSGRMRTKNPRDSLDSDPAWAGIDLIARSAGGEADSTYGGHRLLRGAAIDFHVDRYRRTLRRGLYALEIGGLNGSTRPGVLRADRVSVRRHVPPAVFRERIGERDPEYEVALHSVEVAGLAFGPLLREGAFVAGSVVVDSADVRILLDERIPKTPELPPVLPHQWAARTARAVRIDTLMVPDARVTYAVHPESGTPRGRLAFTEISAEARNLSTEHYDAVAPAGSPDPRPAVLQAEGLLAGMGRFRLDLEMPLPSDDLSFTLRAAVGPMDVPALNAMLIPVNGISIERGSLDTLWSEAVVRAGSARGTVSARYQDLNLSFVRDGSVADRVWGRFKSLLVNRVAVASSSGPEVRTGRIAHRYRPDTAFPKFVWRSVRSGILDLIER